MNAPGLITLTTTLTTKRCRKRLLVGIVQLVPIVAMTSVGVLCWLDNLLRSTNLNRQMSLVCGTTSTLAIALTGTVRDINQASFF